MNIDNGINVAFRGSDGFVNYKELDLKPLSYMDDIGKLSIDAKSAQDANKRIEQVLESKLLDLNTDNKEGKD